MSLKRIVGGFILGLTAFWLHTAHAQATYPNRPIRIVIGFAAGGGTDSVLRALAAELSNNMGVPIIVDNKAGANGNIAGDIVAKSTADGYTLLYNTSSMVLSPSLYKKLSYDFTKELTPIALTANIPLLLVVPPNVAANTPKELIDYLRANPDKNYASAGNGNVTHLATVQMLKIAGVTATHVPYKSEAPALADVLGGQVQFYLGTANALIPLVKQNRVKGLAVSSLKRIEQIPDIPTLSETILPGIEFGAWSGMMAPANTSPEIITKLNDEVNKALQNPELRKKINATGAEVRGSTVAQYSAFLTSEAKRWGESIQAAGIQPE